MVDCSIEHLINITFENGGGTLLRGIGRGMNVRL